MRTGGAGLGPRGPLALLLCAFGFFGLLAGCYAVLLVDLVRALDISPGLLGIALLSGSAASIAAMAALGWIFDRPERRAYLALACCAWGAGMGGLALAGSFPAFVAAQVLFNTAAGLWDVGINAVAVDLEKLSGRRFMSYLHATYSAGAVVGSVGAGALVGAGADYRLVYSAFLAAPAALVVALLVFRLPGRIGKENEEPTASDGDAGGHWSLFRSVPLVMIAFVAALGLLSEGQMGNWSGIYLRDSLAIGALLGGSGVAVFYAAMAAGRFGTGRVVRSIGNRRTLVASGLLVALGASLALATELPALAVGGLFLVGLAVAGVVPVAYSAAGDLAPGRAGSAVSVMSTFGYGGFLLGPPLVGGLAELIGLRGALGIIAVAGLAISVLSLRLGTDGKKTTSSS